MARGWIDALGAIPLLAIACVLGNPEFMPASASEASSGGSESAASASMSSTSAASATTTGASTSVGTSGASASGASGGETSGDGSSGVDPSMSGTTTSTTTDATTTDGATDATTDATTTGGGVPPGTYKVDPTIATCVFLNNGNGYGGPPVCSANASAQNGTGLAGLMQIDTNVVSLDGLGRRAESYLRFDIPAEYAGMTIAAATLYAQIADGPYDYPHGPGGLLVSTTPFDDASLASGPPGLGAQIAPAKGYLGANETTSWGLPTNLVIPGQGLFLGLQPTDNNGTFYRGKTTPGAPYLELVLQ